MSQSLPYAEFRLLTKSELVGLSEQVMCMPDEGEYGLILEVGNNQCKNQNVLSPISIDSSV